jgi:hypothetical protein
MSDSIVQTVIQNFEKRSIIGYLKYGTNLDRIDLSYMQWINHLQEELMDAILYLEKIKQTQHDSTQRLPDNDKGSSGQITSIM